MSDPGQQRGDAPPDEADAEVVEATVDEEPGHDAIEHVPLKVVPMYVDVDEQPAPEQPPAPEPPRRKRPFVGIAALVLAVGAGALHAAGVVVAAGGDFPTGTLLAWLAIGTSILAFVVAAVAAIGGWGRRLGFIAAALAVLVNPWIVLRVLGLLGGA